MPELGNIGVEVECIISNHGEALIGTRLLREFFDEFGIDFVNSKMLGVSTKRLLKLISMINGFESLPMENFVLHNKY